MASNFGSLLCLAVHFSILLATTFTINAAATDLGYFWHITDIHIDRDYDKREECKPGKLGNYNCDTPVPLFTSAMDLMARVSREKAPDFVVFTGDSGPHLKVYSEPALEADMLTVSGEFRRVFPPNNSSGIYILPSLGNHDLEPDNRMSTKADDAKRTKWCSYLAETEGLWSTWIKWNGSTPAGQAPPEGNFSNACFFSKLIQLPSSTSKKSILLVSLNGLLWYTGNPDADPNDPDPLGQLAWLDSSFKWARDNQVKVVVTSHFPPGASPNAPKQFRFLHPIVGDRFLQILRDNHDLIMTVLVAHIHTDSFRVLYSANGSTPLVSIFIGSALNPFTLRGLGGFNPRVRLYRYRQSDLQVVGYEQYYLDLAAQDKSTAWQLEYDSATAYALADLAPASLSGLLDKFAKDSSPNGVWSEYWSHELGRRPHEPKPGVLTPDGNCPDAKSLCRCQHLCAMRNLNLDRLDKCLLTCSGRSVSFSLLLVVLGSLVWTEIVSRL